MGKKQNLHRIVCCVKCKPCAVNWKESYSIDERKKLYFTVLAILKQMCTSMQEKELRMHLLHVMNTEFAQARSKREFVRRVKQVMVVMSGGKQ